MMGSHIYVYVHYGVIDGVQQVSWLSMYRMLEDQHRGELRAQHAEHQRRINDMQHYLEGELLSQQQNMRQKLDFHREVLTKYSSYIVHVHIMTVYDFLEYSF